METETGLDLIENGWFSERNEQWPGVAASVQVNKILLYKKTKYQDLLIFESKSCGNVLVLDGCIQLDDKSERIYHEMLVHVPLYSHENPENILLIGGGDGGCIRELVKHSCVKKIKWVEIDNDVINACIKYFPNIASKNNDKRVELTIGDAFEYVCNKNKSIDKSYDIIICDTSDPEGPASTLFTNKFYNNCYRLLKKGGILILQSGSCLEGRDLLNVKELMKIVKKSLKGNIKYSHFYTPMYTDGQLGFMIAVKDDNNKILNKPCRNIPDSMDKQFRYYNKDIHTASFVLPSHTRNTLLYQSKL